MNDRLRYRRQFILVESRLNELGHWQELEVGGRWLYVHPDLELATVEAGSVFLVLLGYWFDPQSPDLGNKEILENVLQKSVNVDAFLVSLKPYVGRFVALY